MSKIVIFTASPITCLKLAAQHRHAARFERPWHKAGLDRVVAAVKEGSRSGKIGDDATIQGRGDRTGSEAASPFNRAWRAGVPRHINDDDG